MLYKYYYLVFLENPQWTRSPEYTSYPELMNRIAFPAVAALLIIVGLCIPKRVVPRNALARISAIILGFTIMLYVAKGIVWGLGFLLITAIGIQAVSLALTLLKRGRLIYEKEGFLVQLGSALLHLGIIVLIFNLALLKGHLLHIRIFWVSTALLLIGMLLSFYGKGIYTWKLPANKF